jgi:hypothetical protein
MGKYIINDKRYNCKLQEARDIAASTSLGFTPCFYILGKDVHWRWTSENGGKWFLAHGGYTECT